MAFPLDNDSTFFSISEHNLNAIPFDSPELAAARWSRLVSQTGSEDCVHVIADPLFAALKQAAHPDQSLLNIERFLDAVPDRGETLAWMASQPRAIEILVRLFVGSPALTELLIREPNRLRWLTDHRGLAEFPSREDFVARARHEADEIAPHTSDVDEVVKAFVLFQRRELLRIAACDTFHLVDLKTATRQLSLLADAIVQVVLAAHAKAIGIDPDAVSVLAFGKLGGLELNYSSDIDLLFVGKTAGDAETLLAQRTIRSLSQVGPDGFLYRVDMRLRPWGKSGPLVVTGDTYQSYMANSAELWEKQAFLKARPIAGDLEMGFGVLNSILPEVFNTPIAEIRANVLAMKSKIERSLYRHGRTAGHVKSGEGGIRDIEFVTQFLQLMHGHDAPWVRTQNTSDALLRLFDVGAIETDQYRVLSAGYLFHRVVEHALQLQDMSARHALPKQSRELAHLANRLDFPSADVFMKHFRGHCTAVRAVFDQVVGDASVPRDLVAVQTTLEKFGNSSYIDAFTPEDRKLHRSMHQELRDRAAVLEVRKPTDCPGNLNLEELVELTIVGRDRPGDLSVIAGLLQASGFSVESADAFPGDLVAPGVEDSNGLGPWFVDRFLVRSIDGRSVSAEMWSNLERELITRIVQLEEDAVGTHADIALRVADSVRKTMPSDAVEKLTPIEVAVDGYRDDADATIIQIRTDDAPGVLFNLTTALALARLDIRRVEVRTESTSEGRVASDTFHVLDSAGEKLDTDRILELRAAIVLTTQFTNLLPHSPDPRRALTQFHEFLENLFTRPGWTSDLASLQDSRVLIALTKLLGVSEFLWDDFLRFQHENLFPIVQDVEGLQQTTSLDDLTQLLKEQAAECQTEEDWVTSLNVFKDRQMLRVDMRLILNVHTAFNTFSRELTAVAEAVVAEATRHYASRYGIPLNGLAACALGKCGGYEMGFASDIELMFLYDSENSNVSAEQVERLVKSIRKAIHTPRDGVFSIDLRLRPHGNAGPLAVSLESFQSYFGRGGPAWPYERQALVKMRPLAIAPETAEFANRVVAARDSLLYVNHIPDVAAVRALREMQVRQLVEADTFNVKMSPGGLADAEYFVQIMQLRWGHLDQSLRTTNTREALRALEALGYLNHEERAKLRDAYRFLRRVINGLRMVRGDARDLTLPAASSDERVFLVRRLYPPTDPATFDADFQRHTDLVLEMTRSLADRVGINTAV